MPSLTPEVKNIISKLFWSTPEKFHESLSPEAIVEQTLNYGNERDFKALTKWLGIDRVAEIFFQQIGKKRNNYHPRTRHFFILYFTRHASRNSYTQSA